MPVPTPLKPTHKAVQTYYQALDQYSGQQVEHESAVRSAFFQLCQTALNPNIRQQAADEMLVQQLLTERLIRRIFDKEEFARQNVIAAAVEKVIDALADKSFSRKEYLKSLDPFYVAIENAPRGLADPGAPGQPLLNTVYERFFQGFSVKVADSRSSISCVRASPRCPGAPGFGLSLGSPGVHILDPCTGTGNFIVNLLGRIPKRDLPRMYREQLFANEVRLMLPRYAGNGQDQVLIGLIVPWEQLGRNDYCGRVMGLMAAGRSIVTREQAAFVHCRFSGRIPRRATAVSVTASA